MKKSEALASKIATRYMVAVTDGALPYAETPEARAEAAIEFADADEGMVFNSADLGPNFYANLFSHLVRRLSE